MIDVRPRQKLGAFRNEWLDSRFHFSFADYRDPARMGWGELRVWNDDRIGPQSGFDMHPHRDMEIVTYVRTGAITHSDNLGNRGRTEAGDVQVMSAGTGIVHAEHNLEDEDTTLFQIWIFPDRAGHKPGWATRRFPQGANAGKLVALASGRAEDREAGALPIHADAQVLGATLRAGETVHHRLGAGRKAYLVPAAGSITVNGVAIGPGDGAAIADEADLAIAASNDAEIVLVDVA
jgi:redox-sensitive bicupin YhaK (pirin superfamily)